MSDFALFGYAGFLGIILALIWLWSIKFKINSRIKKAQQAPARHATILKVSTTGNSSTVLFQFDDGERVSLVILNSPYMEGESGMLRYNGVDFGSFVPDK